MCEKPKIGWVSV